MRAMIDNKIFNGWKVKEKTAQKIYFAQEKARIWNSYGGKDWRMIAIRHTSDICTIRSMSHISSKRKNFNRRQMLCMKPMNKTKHKKGSWLHQARKEYQKT